MSFAASSQSHGVPVLFVVPKVLRLKHVSALLSLLHSTRRVDPRCHRGPILEAGWEESVQYVQQEPVTPWRTNGSCQERRLVGRNEVSETLS